VFGRFLCFRNSIFQTGGNLFYQKKDIWLVCIICLLTVSCGYRFSGGGVLPGAVKKISVTILKNKTAETGMENTFTNDLINEFTRSSSAVVTKEDEADAVISGVITSVNIQSISHSGSHTSLERRATALVSIKLADKNGDILWYRNGISENETYNVTSDQLVTEQNKAAALSELSKRLAEKIHILMTNDF
jgi:outer membrane lipopolysaccharide assembly protein LptE/RlpB